jgi:glycosyltransferase involved in cell wall biosynthesis
MMAVELHPKTVAWFSYFPVEWLPDAPAEVKDLPRFHPASWQRVLLESLENLVPDLRLHVVVLRKQFPRSFQFRRRNVTFHLIRTPGRLRATSLFWVDTILIRRVLKQMAPDVVHAWGTEQGAALVARRLGYPYLVTVQGLMTWYREVGQVSLHGRFAAHLERMSLPHAPLVTTESRFSVEFVRQRFAPPSVQQIEHAPDRRFFEITRTPQLSPLRLIAVGRMDERKGVDLLLRALNQLVDEVDFELVVVGGIVEPVLAELQRELPPKLWRRVVLKGRVGAAEVARELEQAAMLICPSRADVSPNTVKEAVVAGLPVVAARVGGIPDYVRDGENGVLAEPNNLASLVNAIRTAVRHPVLGRGQVEAEVLRGMRAYLSPEKMAAQFWAAYQAVERRQLKGGE